ncbi:MAG: trimeric intracellular cation channel family protein [Henriciella sp.]|uniref:trimeric intracellular cation channel family protein n=1 Tax=Henriciella sp. TaxID=1968823 RepID=UPI002634B1CA|nr:trimeric intracellular cation channel family protein [Henriciella sp.]
MSLEFLLFFADRIGVFVFAISGGVLAVRKQMDMFGVIVLAFLPAFGGGTLRDLLLDQPVFWLDDAPAILLAIAGGLTAFWFSRPLNEFKPLRWADAFGMSLFAVSGAAKAAALDYGVMVVVIMGVMTASAGGLMRDVVANEEPLVLKEGELYATAAFAGTLAYWGLSWLAAPEPVCFLAGLATAFILRGMAIIFGLKLPISKA